MMTFRYVHEKAYNAARALAVGEQPLSERIEAAYLGGLGRLDGEFDEDSRALEEEWEAIIDTMVRDGATLARTLTSLDDSDLHDLAEAIMDFYGHVEKEWGRRESTGTQYE